MGTPVSTPTSQPLSADLAGAVSPNVGQSVAIIEQLARDGGAMALANFKGQTFVKPIKATEEAAKEFL